MKRRSTGHSNGMTLVLNMIVMVVFAMMAAIVYAGAKSMAGEVVYNARSAQALAIAEAGLEDALHSLHQNSTWRDGFSGKPFGGGSYTVTLTTDTNTPPVITATGYSAPLPLKGPAVRTITVLAQFTAGACPYAVIADKALIIDGRVDAYDPMLGLSPSATSFVTGADVRSNAGVSVGGDSCPPAHIFGDVIAQGSGPAGDCVAGTVTITTVTVTVPTFDCPACGGTNNNLTGIMPSSAYTGGQKLTVNAGQTVTLSSGVYYFKQMDVNGTLNVDAASGTVSIYLKNNFISNPGCQINNLSKIPSRLRVYGINAGNPVRLNCSTPLHAYLEGSQANFELAQEFYGHFCADRVRISSAPGAVGILHYDIGGGLVSRVTWTTGPTGSWTESYKRQ